MHGRGACLVAVGAVLALVATGCSWDRARFDAGNTGANPIEVTIGAGNVGSLGLAFRTTAHPVQPGDIPDVLIRGDTMFASGGPSFTNGVRSFPTVPDGTCAGSPKECPPRWTALSSADATAVRGGVLFSERDAYDAAGVNGCTGTPRVCTRRWTETAVGAAKAGDGTFGVGDLQLAGFVFNNGPHAPPGPFWLEGYDAKGVKGCSGFPKTCFPIWEIETSAGPAPAAGADRVFAIAPGGTTLGAYDAKAATMWTAPLGGFPAGGAIVLAEGIVVVPIFSGTQTSFLAFDARGTNGCSGSPKVCTSLWSTSGLDGFVAAAAATNGRLFVTAGGTLRTYDLRGHDGCALTHPALCEPLWTASTGTGDTSAPSVANGVVYTASSTGALRAFSADGTQGCAGAPKVCAPLWTSGIGQAAGAPVISAGQLFIPTVDGRVTVFRPTS